MSSPNFYPIKLMAYPVDPKPPNLCPAKEKKEKKKEVWYIEKNLIYYECLEY